MTKPTNEKLLKSALLRLYLLDLGVGSGLTLYLLNHMEKINNSNVLIFSLGLLTFLAIFYTLLTQPSIKYKIDDLKKKLSDLERREKSVYKKGMKKAADIGLEEEYEGKYKREIDFTGRMRSMLLLDFVLYVSVISLILSSVLALIDFTKGVLILLLLFGIVGTFHIITVFVLLNSEEMTRLVARFGWRK